MKIPYEVKINNAITELVRMELMPDKFYLQIRGDHFRAIPNEVYPSTMQLHGMSDCHKVDLLAQNCSCGTADNDCAHLKALNKYVLKAYRLERELLEC